MPVALVKPDQGVDQAAQPRLAVDVLGAVQGHEEVLTRRHLEVGECGARGDL